MTGVCLTRPAAPKPMTGTPSEASRITGKSAGNVVPTGSPAPVTAGARSIVAISRIAGTIVSIRSRCAIAVLLHRASGKRSELQVRIEPVAERVAHEVERERG